MADSLSKTRILIASDHAGFALKEALIPYIGTLGYEVEDMGAYELVLEDDYPDYILPCARAVARSLNKPGVEPSRGIILGGSGQGEAMAANHVPGIRAAVFYGGSRDILTLSREHNNANMLSLGARFLSEEEAKEAVKLFLEASFSGDARHVRRIHKF